MYALPDLDVAAEFNEGYQEVVWGQIQEWTPTDIAALNVVEAPEFQLTRVRVNGQDIGAYAYEYTGQDLSIADPILNGKFYPTDETVKNSIQDDQEMPDFTIR